MCLCVCVCRRSCCRHAGKLRDAGADQTCVVNSEAGLNLGSTLLADLGTPETDISLLRRGIHEALAVRTAATAPSRRSSGGGSGSIDAETVQSALDSMDSASGSSGSSSGGGDGKGIAHALSLGALMEGGGSGGGEGEQQKQKKPKKEVEVFVLDGRMSYGLDMQSRTTSAAADVVERPCSDCPLLTQSGALLPPQQQQQQLAALPTAASLNGAVDVSGSGAEGHSNGSVPATAAEAVSATSSSPSKSPNSLGSM